MESWAQLANHSENASAAWVTHMVLSSRIEGKGLQIDSEFGVQGMDHED